ncbi:MAG: radical SAM protein [Bacillota bacterium]
MKNKNIKTMLIDGYLDEPSCLGVPPYISPHIRYSYGALLDSGIKEKNLSYLTIDRLRKNWQDNLNKLEDFDLVIIIAGTTVPGHYLGGKPISLTEIKELASQIYYPQKVLGGPVTLIKDRIEGFDHICGEIASFDLYRQLTGEKIKSKEISLYINNWARIGAKLTQKHPDYPYLVCELETFRGCPRSHHCAFCSERLKNITYQRKPEAIIKEVKALSQAGNHFYRLGCQTDLLLYQAHHSENKFIPNPGAIKDLYQGIRETDPELKVLHMDNMNPATIARFEEKSREILKTITRYNTTGDIAAFGLESADPVVLKKNNIDTDPDLTFKAINIINETGGHRQDGIPKLLPGLNFLHGLTGEREETLEYNYNFLKKVVEQGLMLRRINIRQVATLGSYPEININQKQFKKYKEKINKNINLPLLKRVFPAGTVIKNVKTETHKGKLTYGRQLGSYPILIGIPGKLKLDQFITVRIIDHGYRSLTGLPWPFYPQKASPEQLAAFPGIGRNRAGKIFIEQPENLSRLKKLMDPDFNFEKWKDWFHF